MFASKLKALFVASLLILSIASPLTSGLFQYSMVASLTVRAPAVSSSGQGILSNITLAVAYPGGGRVFFSALPYTEIETQGAARVAAYVATTLLGLDFSSYDYYVLVESGAPLIGGPSSGALMAVGFLALLSNSTITETTTMTGMINPDGSVGPVGGLKEKLDAAANSGFKVFLIPSGQRVYRYPKYEEVRVGPLITVTRITYESIDLLEYGRKLNVSVVEVNNIAEALYYFTEVNITRTRPLDSGPSSLPVNIGVYFSNLSRRVSTILMGLTGLAQRIGGYYGYRYLKIAEELNSTYNNLVSAEPLYPIYSTLSMLKVYENALKAYWSLQLITNQASLGSVISDLNSTLVSTINEAYSEECSIESSLIQALIINAWLHYNGVQSSGDSSEKISGAATVARLVETVKMFRSLIGNSRVTIECAPRTYTNVYSHALGIYTYASRLLEEAGTNADALKIAAEYVNVLNYAYENNSTAIIGASIYVIGYSISAVHSAFNSFNSVLNNKQSLMSLYPVVEGGVIHAIYLELLREAEMLGDIDTSITAYSFIVALLQVYSSTCRQNGSYNKAGPDGCNHNTQGIGQAENSTSKNSSVETPQASASNLQGEVAMALTAFVVLIAMILAVVGYQRLYRCALHL